MPSHKSIGGGLVLTLGKDNKVKFKKEPTQYNRWIKSCMKSKLHGSRQNVKNNFTECAQSYTKEDKE